MATAVSAGIQRRNTPIVVPGGYWAPCS